MLDQIHDFGTRHKTKKIIRFGGLVIGLGLAMLGMIGNITASNKDQAGIGTSLITAPGLFKTHHAAFQQAGNQPETAPGYLTGQVIVKLKKGKNLTDIQSLNQKYRVKQSRNLFKNYLPTNPFPKGTPAKLAAKLDARQKRAPQGKTVPSLENILVLDLSEGTTDLGSIIKQYQADPNVEYAEPNYTYKIQTVPNDPYYHSQNSWGQGYDDLWGLKQIGAESAWDLSQGEGVVVAVIDTGIDYHHEDIAANLWANPGEIAGNGMDDDGNGYVDDVYGYDFENADGDPRDDNGHGNHVAGTIAAVGNNSLGIIGVAPKAKVMAVKGLDADGYGDSEALANCILYAADNGADVLNNSWGGSGRSQIIEDAINYAVSKGCVVVASAGNSSNNVMNSFPACLDDVIAVAATNHDRSRCSFSNWGSRVDVAAPGGGTYGESSNILSLLAANSTISQERPELIIGTSYLRLQGTSMASPHVAGLAALLLAYFPQATTDDIRSRLIATTDPVIDQSESVVNHYIGSGIINAYSALTATAKPHLRLERTEAMEDQGDGDSVIESNESAKLVVRLENIWKSANSVTVSLSSSSPHVSSIVTPVCYLGAVGQSQTVDNATAPFIFRTQGIEYDTPIEFILTVNADGAIQTQQIFVYAGLKRLSSDNLSLSPLAASDNNLAWTGLTDNNLQSNIYFYDYKNKREIKLTNDPHSSPTNVDISGGKIVWDDYPGQSISGTDILFPGTGTEIFLFDLATNQLRQITTNSSDQKYPAISGNRIVWQDRRNNGFDVYLYDLDTNQESRITSNTRNIWIEPLISGSRVVWNEGPDIFLYDLETRQERKIISGTGDKQFLSFYGSKLVWSDDRNLTGVYNIYLYDLLTNQERCLTSEPWDHYNPNIFGNRIVWGEYQNGNEDIYLYQMETGQKTRITRNLSSQFSPVISDQWISWIDNRDPDVLQTIYCVDIPQAAAPPPAPVIAGSPRLSDSELRSSFACSDPLYEIIEYQYAIGTEPGGADVCPWTSTGPTVIRTDLNLTIGQTYYLSVKAKNDAGLWSEAACFPVISEDIPSKIAFVNDGTGLDLRFSAEPDVLSANWAASTGGLSGVKNYWYAIGTTSGGTDLVDWTNNGLNLSVTRTGLNLIHGRTYYFAVKVENNAGYLSLPVFSDGQAVDLTPPVILFLVFNIATGRILPIASDNESGIISYYYAIGTAPGSTDLVDWTDNGDNPSIERRDLVLTPGCIYYCSVKAKNGAGAFSKVAGSTGQIYDPTPPAQISVVNDGPGPDIDFTPYQDRLSANWNPSSDPESGISHYYYCVGTTPGSANLAGWTDNGPNTSVTLTGLHLVNGATYYFSVKAKNGAGIPMESYSEVTTSDGQTVDTTPPLPIATVNDGSGADIQFTSNPFRLAANWTPSADPESEVVKYYYAIGTAPGITDVKDWTDNGLNTTAESTGLNLTHGVTYYISVKALNGAGLYSNVTSSNGQMVDTTPPFPISVVYDGVVIGVDIKSTPSTTQLSANWTPSTDDECSIIAYYYAIGTAPGLTDVVGWTNAGLNTMITKTGLNLVKGQTYYFSIKALSASGSMSTVTSSNGQRVRKNRKN